MPSPLIIRKARLADAQGISELIRSVAHHFRSGASADLAPWFAASIAPSSVAGTIEDPRFNYLVGLAGQTLAGVITLRDATHVHHLFVATAFHRHGVATALWERAKADAVASGHCTGFSVRSSEFAVPVYERFGFRVTGARTEQDGLAFVPMTLDPPPEHG